MTVATYEVINPATAEAVAAVAADPRPAGPAPAWSGPSPPDAAAEQTCRGSAPRCARST